MSRARKCRSLSVGVGAGKERRGRVVWRRAEIRLKNSVDEGRKDEICTTSWVNRKG